MAVAASDLKLYAPANLPADFTSTIGGAIDTGTEITGATINELFLNRKAEALGGSDIYDYTCGHIKNTNGSDDLSNAKVWIDNGLIAVPSQGTFAIVSTSADDDSDYYVNLIFENAGGTYVAEEVVLSGTTTVYSSGTAKAGTIVGAELRSVSDDSLQNANGDISIQRASLLGKIPAGYHTASAVWAIGLEPTLDTSETSTDRTTAPSGIVFSKVNTYTAGLDVANSGVLTHGTAQQVWMQRVLPDGMLTMEDCYFVLKCGG